MNTENAFAVILFPLLFPGLAQAVTFEWATIGNPGNAPDTEIMDDGTTGYGSVGYTYRISKHEVTNSQYVEFLNAVAQIDAYELYDTRMSSKPEGGIIRNGSPGSYTYLVKPDAVGQGFGGTDYAYGNKPVVYVSWYDSLRFINWLNNGEGNGDTETGAYTLVGGGATPTNGDDVLRNPTAQWVLPSEDEWYKAAYHKNDGDTGNYWDFPTSTDLVPDNNHPSADTGNSVNYHGSSFTTGSHLYVYTDVGAYLLTENPYGTFDQGGNVYEWNEAKVDFPFGPSERGIRGSAYDSDYDLIAASGRNEILPESQFSSVGFRVAMIQIPEPSSLTLATLVAAALLIARKRFGVFMECRLRRPLEGCDASR